MTEITPYFYKSFACIGSACKDNCCTAGWEIDIDKKSLKYYKSVGGDFGKQLAQGITDGHFKLKNGICPFLNEKNLCNIILKCGEDNLCEICTEHPRFHEWFKNRTESGVGLCCEEAGRLLFQNSEPLAFVASITDEPKNEIEYSDELFAALSEARTLIFNVAQDRRYPLMKRIILVEMLTERVQECIDSKRLALIKPLVKKYSEIDFQREIYLKLDKVSARSRKSYIGELLDFYAELEPLNDEWTNALIKMTALDTADDDFAEALEPFEYALEHVFVYTVFRYFLKAVFDKDAYGKLAMATNSVILTKLFLQLSFHQTGRITKDDCINAAKAYSKQIEYDDEIEAQISKSTLFKVQQLIALL